MATDAAVAETPPLQIPDDVLYEVVDGNIVEKPPMGIVENVLPGFELSLSELFGAPVDQPAANDK